RGIGAAIAIGRAAQPERGFDDFRERGSRRRYHDRSAGRRSRRRGLGWCRSGRKRRARERPRARLGAAGGDAGGGAGGDQNEQRCANANIVNGVTPFVTWFLRPARLDTLRSVRHHDEQAMEQALLLNASYEPLKVVDWQKAVTLWCQGKVEVIAHHEREIRAVSFTFKLPSVIRLLR